MALKVMVSVTIQADRDTVWTCFTAPGHITQWNFASEDWHCPSAENDVRPGGRYCARMEARDGSFGFDFEAVYDDVVERESLSYTMPDGRKVNTVFIKSGTGTSVTTTFDAESENPVEMQREGWQMILNNFKKYVERLEKSKHVGK